jgi:hypothetical protein
MLGSNPGKDTDDFNRVLSWVFLSPSSRLLGWKLKINEDCVFAHPFQFINTQT